MTRKQRVLLGLPAIIAIIVAMVLLIASSYADYAESGTKEVLYSAYKYTVLSAAVLVWFAPINSVNRLFSSLTFILVFFI